MDALSHLLSLYPVHTALDTRCIGPVAWQVERSSQPYGTAPYHLVVHGAAVLQIAGQTALQLRAGDMLVLLRGQAHTLDIGTALLPDRPADILCGQFHFSAAASNLITALPDVMLIRTAEDKEFFGLQALINLLRDEAGGRQPGADAVVSHLASALLALTLRAWLKQADTVPGVFALLADQRMAPSLQAMLAAPERRWSLEHLAGLCHMSRSTFLRAFRKVSGATPGELLTRIRMAQAAQWLKQEHRNVGDVGAAAGYQSEAAFNRAFKRYMGEGPGQYRRGHTGHEAEAPAGSRPSAVS